MNIIERKPIPEFLCFKETEFYNCKDLVLIQAQLNDIEFVQPCLSCNLVYALPELAGSIEPTMVNGVVYKQVSIDNHCWFGTYTYVATIDDRANGYYFELVYEASLDRIYPKPSATEKPLFEMNPHIKECLESRKFKMHSPLEDCVAFRKRIGGDIEFDHIVVFIDQDMVQSNLSELIKSSLTKNLDVSGLKLDTQETHNAIHELYDKVCGYFKDRSI